MNGCGIFTPQCWNFAASKSDCGGVEGGSTLVSDLAVDAAGKLVLVRLSCESVFRNELSGGLSVGGPLSDSTGFGGGSFGFC